VDRAQAPVATAKSRFLDVVLTTPMLEVPLTLCTRRRPAAGAYFGVLPEIVMESQDKRLGKESARTDESLPAERNRTDRELADKRSSIEDEADAVVQRARSHVGDVLEAARATEDQGSHGPE